jgi:serine/threonine protein kinase
MQPRQTEQQGIDREKIVDELFARAIDLGPTERQAFLADASAKDSAVASEGVIDEVIDLLHNYQSAEASEFLQQPLLSVEGDEAPPALAAGQEFEGYRILKLIAEGGMGEVYLAEDAELDRKVAIKLIKSQLKTKELLRRFHNERQILASLQHANIAKLFQAGTTADGLPFFVMEYVNGKPIDKYADEKNLSITERLKLFRTVCSAVSYAHQNLVIHRDIKPSNVLVNDDGEPKLLDFGIAKLLHESDSEQQDATATLFRVMTPEYASPEQVKADRITAASDVYSLGVLLYGLLTGNRPYRFNSGNSDEVARAICERQPEKPSRSNSDYGLRNGEARHDPQSPIRNLKALRGDLDNIVLKALRKEPQRRYASVEQFSEDIRRHIVGLPVSARKDTLSYRTSKFVQRNRLGVAAAILILLALGAGIVATTIEARRANRRFNDVRRLAHSVLFDYNDQIAALPGSTKVREGLVKDSLEYLNNLSQEVGSDRSLLRELADAYEKVAALQGGIAMSGHGTLLATSNLGDLPGALESLRKAVAIREQVLAMEPHNKDAQQELAFCYVTIGFLQVLNGPPDKAVENLRKGMPIMEALQNADPTSEDLQYKLWNVYLALAKALGSPGTPNLGDTVGALAFMNKAQALGEDLVSNHPTNLAYQNMLSAMQGAFGAIQFGTGNKQEALDSYKKSVVIAQEIVDRDPSNTFYRRQLAVALVNVGNTMLEMNEKAGALDSFTQALAIYESLVSADPNDASIRKNYAAGYRNMGMALGSDNRAEALNNFHKALQIFSNAAARDPNNADLGRQWAYTYLAMSRFQSEANDLNGAMGSALEGIKIDEVVVASSPTNVGARNTLALLDSPKEPRHLPGHEEQRNARRGGCE